MNRKIIIGSRGSNLALWQAYFFQDRLEALGVTSEIKIIKTKGDNVQHLSFDKMEGKGFFTKEIESALLNEEIDVAIHSHKDLETAKVDGLVIAGVSHREDPSELLLTRTEGVQLGNVLSLRQHAVVGTSSARRKSQLLALRPDLIIKDIRGNVPTRIQKLRDGHFDAIMLANAGVKRLELDVSDLNPKVLDPRIFVPAPAQGVLAYQCREGDEHLIQIIGQLNDSDVASIVAVERGILKTFGGGCQIPLGVVADFVNGQFEVRVSVAEAWNAPLLRYRFKAESATQAAESFMELHRDQRSMEVFISTDRGRQSLLDDLCRAQGITLHCQSLIAFEALPFELPDSFDWIFFSSKNAVKAFFEQQPFSSISGKKLAAFGEATARALYDYVSKIDFIANPAQPKEVAAQLDQVVKGATVFFPTSKASLRTIPNALKKATPIVASAYTSHHKHEDVQASFDAYIFTSPSNVNSFLDAGNTMGEGARIIALGTSTAAALDARGFEPMVADVPHALELFALLNG